MLAGGCAVAGLATPADDAAEAKRSGDYPRALALYGQLIAQDPGNAGYYLQLGTVQGWSGRHREAIATLEKGLALAPGDTDLRLAQARAYAWAGELGHAEELARGLAAAQPGNREVANLLGRVLLWQRRFDAAEEVFAGILAQAPDDTDALIGAGDVQRYQEQNDAARPYYEHAARLDPRAPEIARRLAAVRGTGRWRLDLGAEGSTFTGNSPRSDWQGADLGLRYALDKRTGLALAAAWARRFDLTDNQVGLGVDHRFDENTAGYLRAAVTPAADFLAERLWETGGEWRVRPAGAGRLATSLLADYRAATYAPGTAHSLWLGVAQATNHRVTVTVKMLFSRNLNARWTQGWQARLDGEPDERWRWNLGYADSHESLSSTVYDFTRDLRTRAVFGGLYRELSPVLGVRLDLTHEWSPGQPARHALHAGLVTHF